MEKMNTTSSDSDSDDDHTDDLMKNKSLNQKLVNLERDWDRFNHHHQLQKLHSSRSLDGGDSDHIFNCYNNTSPAPTIMMTSEQLNIKSPSNESWKVRTNDFAIQEVLRERKAAIESGKLKGRRLFTDFEKEAATTVVVSTSPDDDEICNDCLDLLEQQLVSEPNNGIKLVDSAGSSSDSASSSGDERLETSDSDQQQKVVLYHHLQVEKNYKQETKKVNVRKGLKSCGRKMVFAIALFCMVFMLMNLNLKLNLKGNYIHDAEVFLVPT